MNDKTFFSSWSGGKDACLALYRTIQQGEKPQFLFTMLEENGNYSRAHRLPLRIVEQQAESLQIPLLTRSATWETYEENFLDGMKTMKQHGVMQGVFGDIDIKDHRKWVENVCAKMGIQAILPLWEEKRRHLIHEFVDLGFVAKIIMVRESALPKEFLGKTFTKETIAEIEQLGVDACGEEGEFHTLVVDGPIFSKPLQLPSGGKMYKDGCWFQTWDI